MNKLTSRLVCVILLSLPFLFLNYMNPDAIQAKSKEIVSAEEDSTAGNTRNNSLSINTGSAPIIYTNKAFKLGERLIFKVRYGFIKAGYAEMKVLSVGENNNQKYYHIQTTARSASGFDWVYKVRDEVNVFLDYDRLYPLRFEKKLREGSYKADLFVDYNHADSIANIEFIRYRDNMKIRKRKNEIIKIPPYVNDILSAFYLIRNQDLQVGQPIYLTTNEKDKIYDLEIQVYIKEILEVEAGKFKTIKIEPLLQDEGIFKSKGRLTVWLSDDQYKIPVKMTTEILVGNITTELTEIIGISDLPSKIK
ncbi:MAG: DUF3108 domain-containing protein [Calditrichaceae bacterium]|nr:DUF3108 domain-containing protein [Calditrichaceae bacterium]